MNNRDIKSLSQIINQAIDAYESFISELENRKPRQRNKRNMEKIKDFLFKRVF